MNAKATTTLIFIMLPLLWAGCAKETVEPKFFGSIVGSVQDSAGVGIPFVSIETSPGTDAILTGQDGQFIIEEIFTGNYSVTAEKDGFITESKRIAVREDRPATANFILEPEESEGASNGNISAEVSSFETRTADESADTSGFNSVHVEYLFKNISSDSHVGPYEVYFDIYTPGPTFYYEVKGDSLAPGERTSGTFSKQISRLEADSVVVSGFYPPGAG